MKSKNNRGKLTMLALPFQRANPDVKPIKTAVKKAVAHATPAYIANTIERLAPPLGEEENPPKDSPPLTIYPYNRRVVVTVSADVILRGDRPVGKPIRHNGKRVGLCYKHKQPLPPVPATIKPARVARVFALFPLRQNGKRAKNPLYVATTQSEAETRKKQFARLCPFGVEIVPQTKR